VHPSGRGDGRLTPKRLPLTLSSGYVWAEPVVDGHNKPVRERACCCGGRL